MKGMPPVETIRDRELKASIWENEGANGKYLTTTFAKTYEDKRSGQLRDTNVFNNSDLLRVSELARQAYTRTNELTREMRQEQTPTPSSQSATFAERAAQFDNGNSQANANENSLDNGPEI